MKTPTKRQIEFFAHLTDAQLEAWNDTIGTAPSARVKSGPSKGHFKISALKRSDEILAELRRRRATI
jgi:hypothetical protein